MEIIHLAGGKGKQAGQARTQARELSALGENQGDGVREGALGSRARERGPRQESELASLSSHTTFVS